MNRSAFSIQNCLAIMVTIGFFGIVVGWMYQPPQGDGASIAVLNTLTGMMGSAFLGVITYFFGSSSGSREKDDTIKNLKTGIGGSGSDTTVITTTPPTTTTTITPELARAQAAEGAGEALGPGPMRPSGPDLKTRP